MDFENSRNMGIQERFDVNRHRSQGRSLEILLLQELEAQIREDQMTAQRLEGRMSQDISPERIPIPEDRLRIAEKELDMASKSLGSDARSTVVYMDAHDRFVDALLDVQFPED